MRELTDEILYQVIKKRACKSYKGTYGRVLVVGGNARYGGAAILAASAAVYAGAGLVTVACAKQNHAALRARLPEAMLVGWDEDLTEFVQAADVVVVGCGLGLETISLSILKMLLSNLTERQSLVIDGSAITLFAENDLRLKFPAQTIFTPHQMELQRLSNLTIDEQSPARVQKFVDGLGATVVAKSEESKIYSPQNEPVFLKIGTPAQATGGMGDTLAGMIGGFLAQFSDNQLATVAAATYLHSYIARDLAKENYVVLPSRIITEIPKFMKKFSERPRQNFRQI